MDVASSSGFKKYYMPAARVKHPIVKLLAVKLNSPSLKDDPLKLNCVCMLYIYI